jgi:UDP-N-acetylglucosamine:LPS N-acetylglucosamine transferase
MKKVDFVFFDAGGGHRSAATALKAVVEQQGRPWEVRMVNLQEVLDSLDIFRKLTGIRMEDVYNKLLAKGWTLGSEYLVPPMHTLIRLYHPAQRRLLTKFWKADPPDLVVSVIPNFERALFQGLKAADPNIPLVTILTDLADYPPNFWMERQDQHLICGTERAVEQAREVGYPAEKVHRTSGMILRPRFYEPIDVDRAEERRKLGLQPDLPTGLVLFGGQGSNVMLDIAKRMSQFDAGAQLIFICGKNEKLAAKLRKVKSSIPFHVVGFTQEVPYFMHLSDFMIGKPGPGSISEALAMKLPVILERNAWTLPQERFNTDWVREKGVGLVLKNFTEIESAVHELLCPEVFPRLKANAAAIQNRAVFEIPDILDRIMQ